MEAFLVLEDGTVFSGVGIGAKKEVVSEIVFNTSMTGYLEVLTDPSYAGQAVVMTYPLIGNYGVCYEDMESKQVWADGFIVREMAATPSNFRSEESLDDCLKKKNVTGIAGIDTRALTGLLREKGTMNGMITTNEDFEMEQVIEQLKAYSCKGVVQKVTEKVEQVYFSEMDSFQNLKVALIDYGSKRNIVRCLTKRGCEVTVYPAMTKAEHIIDTAPDGIMLSNGPGDPKEYTELVEEVRKLYDSKIPIFGVCFGHQLMALANGADTHKMKYGHRGANHPVKDLTTGRVYISSQNHGYVVDDKTLDEKKAEVSFINVNDRTVEGIKYRGKNVFTVQFHPEACSGPQDTEFLFDRFIHMMEVAK